MSVERASFRGWLVCLVASLFFFFSFSQIMVFNALDPSLMKYFHITATDIGTLSAALFWANIIFLFPAGILLDRFSTRTIILVTLSLMVVGTFLFSVTTSFSFGLFCRFLIGIGSAFALLSCLRLASRWFPAHQMALISGVIVTMAMAGGMASQTLLRVMVADLGWRHALQVDALVGIVFVVLMFFVIRNYPKGYAYVLAEGDVMSLSHLWHTIKKAVVNRHNWIFGVYTCLLNLAVFLLGAVWGSLYLTQAHHLSAAKASYVVSMLFLGCIFGSPIIGWISDTLRRRKAPMLVGAMLSIITVLIIMYVPNLSFDALMVLFFILGFITSTQVLSYPAVAECNDHEMVGSALGLASVLIMSGGAIFPPLFGKILDLRWSHQYYHNVPFYSLHAYNVAMLILPITFAIGFVLVLFARETCNNQ